MPIQAKWPFMAAISAVAIIAVVTAVKYHASTPSLGTSKQTLSGIEEPRAGAAGASYVPASATSQRQPPRIAAEVSEPSPAEQVRIQHALVARLDDRLRAEPVDTNWASEQEVVIHKALAGTPGDGFDAPPPDSMDEECRSSMCRISMVYKDEEDAVQMHGRLTLGLGGAIATAKTFFLPRSDGGVEMIVFASRPDRLK